MLENALSTVRSVADRIMDRIKRPFYLIAFPLGLGLTINALLGRTVWRVALANQPAFPSVATQHLLAAAIEPTTTKLLPAAVIIAQLRTRYHSLRSTVARHPVLMAVVLGLVVGVAEVFFVKLPANPQAAPLAVVVCGLPTTLMHGVTGTLIATTLFAMANYDAGGPVIVGDRSLGDQLYWALGLLIIGFSVALLFHVWWNTGGNEPVYALAGLDC